MTGTPLNRLPTLGAVRRPAGFTLIEILVVIVILGVVIAIATVSVGVLGRDREVEDQAKRLWAVMTQGREEAELQGRDFGVFLDDTSYEFMMFDPKRSGSPPRLPRNLGRPARACTVPSVAGRSASGPLRSSVEMSQ